MRYFDTGATRDSDEEKLDPEGFLSPLVLERFSHYMHKHRFQRDGVIRDSDNWQKGIPIEAYRKSLIRHVWDAWKLWRGHPVLDRDTGEPLLLEDALCAILFNVQGYLHELLLGRDAGVKTEEPDPLAGLRVIDGRLAKPVIAATGWVRNPEPLPEALPLRYPQPDHGEGL